MQFIFGPGDLTFKAEPFLQAVQKVELSDLSDGALFKSGYSCSH